MNGFEVARLIPESYWREVSPIAERQLGLDFETFRERARVILHVSLWDEHLIMLVIKGWHDLNPIDKEEFISRIIRLGKDIHGPRVLALPDWFKEAAVIWAIKAIREEQEYDRRRAELTGSPPSRAISRRRVHDAWTTRGDNDVHSRLGRDEAPS